MTDIARIESSAPQDPSGLTGVQPSDMGYVSSTCRPVRRNENPHEWGAVEWAVQCIYRASSKVGLNSLWAVEHPDLNRAFDASLTGIDSDARESSFVASVEATELPPRMPIRRVAQHGFVGVERQQYFQDTFTYLFKVRSFRIHLGNRKLPAPRDLIRRSGVDFFEVVLCKVRLGQTEVSGESCPPPASVIAPYDAYLMSRDEEQLVLDVHPLLCPWVFSHQYLIRDAQSQLLPIYIARIRVASSGEAGSCAASPFDGRPPPALLQGLPCDICETNCSTLWCVNDEARLCKECDYRLHEVGKLGDPDQHSRSEELLRHMRESSMIIRQRHVRVPINERPGTDTGVCHLAPLRDGVEELPAAWWDRKLEIPVSNIAKEEQYPINLDQARLQPLVAAYQEAVSIDSNKSEPRLDTKEFLLSLLHEIDSLASQLERESGVSVDTRLRTVHSHAMQKLTFHCEKVMTDLLTAEETAQNHLNILKWARELVAPQQELMTPKVWLELWVEHYRLLKDLTESINADVSSQEKIAEPSHIVEKCSMKVELSMSNEATMASSRTYYSAH